MTQAEFKAWFDGFTEAMDSTPNEKQWKRIKERVKQIDGVPVTERIYVDRYWPVPHWYNNGLSGVGVATCHTHSAFNSSTAMLALGRAEAVQ